jgi:uncharacterized membrane protein YbhN (UPF0104 family)
MGMFWNLWMPTNIGGDAVRVWAVRPYCPGLAVAASSVLVERLTGFFALMLLGAGGLGWSILHRTAQRDALQTLGVAFVFFAIGIAGTMALKRTSFKHTGFLSKIQKKLTSLSEATLFYIAPGQRRVLASVLLLSLLFQASQIVLNIALAAVVGLSIPSVTFWWLVPILSLASLLPIGIGGLGVREAAAAALLGPAAPMETIVVWSLLWQATIWLASLPGVLPVLSDNTRLFRK